MAYDETNKRRPMFNREPTTTPLDREAARLLGELKLVDPKEKEYTAILRNLTELNSMKPNKPNRISADTALTVAANLIGITMIIRHEKLNVITTKALNFVGRT